MPFRASCLWDLLADLGPYVASCGCRRANRSSPLYGHQSSTGTPLYLLLMKFWESVFPFGTIVWRMNLLNALLSAVAVGILSQRILRLSLHWGASRVRAGLLALCLSLTWPIPRPFGTKRGRVVLCAALPSCDPVADLDEQGNRRKAAAPAEIRLPCDGPCISQPHLVFSPSRPGGVGSPLFGGPKRDLSEKGTCLEPVPCTRTLLFTCISRSGRYLILSSTGRSWFS